MEDLKIIELYEARDDDAIAATKEKYGSYMGTIAYNILRSREDCEECVEDSYMKVWNVIPPEKPRSLKAFLARITRNTALDYYDRLTAKRRGGGEIALALDELSECVSSIVSDADPAGALEAKELSEAINSLLDGLSFEARKIFVLRYFNLYSVSEIAKVLGVSPGKVSTSLSRSRSRLKEGLDALGYKQ